MSWLSRIALVLGLWAVAAAVFVELGPMVGPVPPNKKERGQKVVATALIVAVACVALDWLIGLGKRRFASNSTARSSGVDAPSSAGLPTPPRPESEGLPDDPHAR